MTLLPDSLPVLWGSRTLCVWLLGQVAHPRLCATTISKRYAPHLIGPPDVGHLAGSPEPYVNIQGPFLVPVKLCLSDGLWLLLMPGLILGPTVVSLTQPL